MHHAFSGEGLSRDLDTPTLSSPPRESGAVRLAQSTLLLLKPGMRSVSVSEVHLMPVCEHEAQQFDPLPRAHVRRGQIESQVQVAGDPTQLSHGEQGT